MIWSGLSLPVCFGRSLKLIWLVHICKKRNVNMQPNQNQTIGLPNITKHSICKYSSIEWIKKFRWTFFFIFIIFHCSMIGNEEQLDFFELHICVKDYCFAREDRLVGVAVLQLKDIVEQVIFVCHLMPFSHSEPTMF